MSLEIFKEKISKIYEVNKKTENLTENYLRSWSGNKWSCRRRSTLWSISPLTGLENSPCLVKFCRFIFLCICFAWTAIFLHLPHPKWSTFAFLNKYINIYMKPPRLKNSKRCSAFCGPFQEPYLFCSRLTSTSQCSLRWSDWSWASPYAPFSTTLSENFLPRKCLSKR